MFHADTVNNINKNLKLEQKLTRKVRKIRPYVKVR